MPAIESPVYDGLPAVQTALMSTAANIATAAGIYAQADQTLGENLTQQRFTLSGANTERSATDRPDTGVLGAALAQSGDIPEADTEIPSPGVPLSTQVGQLNGTIGAANSFTQSVIQGVQGMAEGRPGAGQPGQRPDAVGEDVTTDEEELDTVPAPGEAGAAGGRHSSSSAAPVQPLTAPRPSTSTPSGTVL